MRSLNTNSASTSHSRDPSPPRSSDLLRTRRSFLPSKQTPTATRKPSTTTALRPRITPRTSTASLSTTTTTTTTTTSSSSSSAPKTTTTPPTPRRQQSTARQPTLSSTLRQPLRKLSQNALNKTPVVRPSIAPKLKSLSDMPPPHDQKGAHAAPRQPVLSASAAKAMGRAPLTPKIASKAQHHHQQPPLVTPLARRKTDLGHGSAASGASGGPGGGVKDDITSPVSAFLSHNITPRSGSRQTRVDSASSTPTGTPNPERNSDWDTRSAFASAFDGDMNRKHVVTFSPPSDVGSRNDPPDSKFFYASDAKPASQPALHKTQQQQQQQPIKAPTFIYANGSAIERNRPTSPSVVPGFTPVLAPTQEAQASKFFYANGAPDFQPAYRPASAAGSTVSSSSKMNAPRAAPTIATGGFAATSRPTSPNKQTQPIPPPLARTATLSPQPASRPQMASPPTLAAQPAAKRRVSIEVPPQHGSHSRNGSVSSGDAIMSRFMASHPSSELSSPTSAPNNPAVTMASIIQAAEDLTESDDSKGHGELQSPTKSTHSGDPLNDLVAHARRERKVQDLEITNASLEAINRSLERQLHKQTAELRRYRRLSRSGRLSLTSMASSRVPSDSTVGTAVGMEGGLELSDLSEDEGEDEEEEDDDLGSLYDKDPSDSESISSPGLKAADRRRKRDERRLQLDLTKHRELLVDSQKINQSIKRCLNWTEELIKDGKKALEYKVRASDVELAPRVLAPQYEDDPDVLKSGDVGDDDGDITLSDSILDEVPPTTATLKGANLAPPWSGDPQIRDSGIELPTDEG